MALNNENNYAMVNGTGQSPRKRKNQDVDVKMNDDSPESQVVSFPHKSESILRPKQRKLVLHVDLNNTILVSDAVTNQGPRAALNSYLSTVTWGKTNHAGEWEWLSDKPSLLPPCQGAINFYTQFGRDTDFTDTNIGKRFEAIHSEHLRLLEWPGPTDKVFTCTGEDGKGYHWILPSFLNLLEGLRQQGRHFAVVLRTFGTDLPRVLHAVHCAMEGMHPEFPDVKMVSLPVDQTPGRIRCSKQEVILTRGAERVSTKSDARNVYRYFSRMEGIGGFQDHFDWWARNSFSSRGGKPFWIDPQDPSVQHIFIDDNIRLNEEDTIVQPKVLVDAESSEHRSVTNAHLYGVCLVQTDLLRAIAEKSYFLECVRDCEEKYADYLSTYVQDTQASR